MAKLTLEYDRVDELCAWCELHATTFADARTSAANWKRMLEGDLVTHQEPGVDPDTGKPVTLVFL